MLVCGEAAHKQIAVLHIFFDRFLVSVVRQAFPAEPLYFLIRPGYALFLRQKEASVFYTGGTDWKVQLMSIPSFLRRYARAT